MKSIIAVELRILILYFKFYKRSYTNRRSITKKYKYEDEIKAPIEKDDVIGYVEYYKNDEIIGEVEILANENIDKKYSHSEKKIAEVHKKIL